MGTQATVTAVGPEACIARQPILTTDERVFGYELLVREPSGDGRSAAVAENTSGSTIDTLNVIGLDVDVMAGLRSSTSPTACCWKNVSCCCPQAGW